MKFPDWWEDELENVGKKYLHENTPYTFVGILDDGDDYYYVMRNPVDYSNKYLSCVGSLENFGFVEEEV